MTTDYRIGDAAYQAAGELEGIQRLCERFYQLMDSRNDAQSLRAMHPADLGKATERLAWFLSGWLGGPALYQQKVGPQSLATSHAHLPVTRESMQAWLDCMQQALEDQQYPPAFRDYMMHRFTTPAQSMLMMAEYRSRQTPDTQFHSAI